MQGVSTPIRIEVINRLHDRPLTRDALASSAQQIIPVPVIHRLEAGLSGADGAGPLAFVVRPDLLTDLVLRERWVTPRHLDVINEPVRISPGLSSDIP